MYKAASGFTGLNQYRNRCFGVEKNLNYTSNSTDTEQVRNKVEGSQI
jgi:hypothetical protein